MKTLLDDFGFERDIAENGKIAVEKMQINSWCNFDGSSNAWNEWVWSDWIY
jgi:hypothetical protein